MNNNVNYQEKTEVNGVFCPFIKENCRIDCVLCDNENENECMLSRIPEAMDSLNECSEGMSKINTQIFHLKQLIEAFNYQEG